VAATGVNAAAALRLAPQSAVYSHETFYIATTDNYVEEITLPLMEEDFQGGVIGRGKLHRFASP